MISDAQPTDTPEDDNESTRRAIVPEPPPSPVPQGAWDRAVGAWIDAHVRSSPIAQGPGAWAHLNDVLPRLRELLEREL